MGTNRKINIFWFRRDLRLDDNHALYRALNSGYKVVFLFIFDTNITRTLPADDHRLSFIYNQLRELHHKLKKDGGCMLIRQGVPLDVFSKLSREYEINAVYCNTDHEQYGIDRDKGIASFMAENGVGFHSYSDHLIMKRDEVLKDDKTPYVVFTPFSKRWKSLFQSRHIKPWPSGKFITNCHTGKCTGFPSLEELGLEPSSISAPPVRIEGSVIENYDKSRDIPSADATTRLGLHLRFGTISIRKLVEKAVRLNEVFLNELIWREFYAIIMWHYPYVAQRSFKPEYDRINWVNDEGHFRRWCEGRTGYPMVDAGMRQLNETGYMHNRLRMITASFLTKHLLTDWRWGEAYFAGKLFDYELSSNNGGWQWSAGSGCDAAPYFRIFNPLTQQKKFDPQEKYIRKWIKEYGTSGYPEPVVIHREARERCLGAYKTALRGYSNE